LSGTPSQSPLVLRTEIDHLAFFNQVFELWKKEVICLEDNSERVLGEIFVGVDVNVLAGNRFGLLIDITQYYFNAHLYAPNASIGYE
jgi:hypothetical protein